MNNSFTLRIYVKANINNVNVKMLVDSGAQKSIMPKKITTLCNLEHLIDKECGGEVSGICAKKNILGNLNKEKFLDIWLSEKAKKNRDLLNSANRSINPCNVCDVKGDLIGKKHSEAWEKIKN